MAASIPLAAMEILVAAYASWNAATTDPQRRISVLNGAVLGLPTDRFVAVYATTPVLTRGSFGPRAADGTGIVTVHFCATRPTAMSSPANEAIELARVGNAALVDNTLTVDGFGPGIYLVHEITEGPDTISVVADRVTSQVTSQFTYIANRL
jgi:hypothetical protein